MYPDPGHSCLRKRGSEERNRDCETRSQATLLDNRVQRWTRRFRDCKQGKPTIHNLRVFQHGSYSFMKIIHFSLKTCYN